MALSNFPQGWQRLLESLTGRVFHLFEPSPNLNQTGFGPLKLSGGVKGQGAVLTHVIFISNLDIAICGPAQKR